MPWLVTFPSGQWGHFPESVRIHCDEFLYRQFFLSKRKIPGPTYMSLENESFTSDSPFTETLHVHAPELCIDKRKDSEERANGEFPY